ncbi:YfjI family protein [uncultured Amphritea sp.]|mgnify:CR=1 FL=1|uniref:YfjI family protein n=1 Tax=uncultured Amphritea sp. TaxID=981605 RepID=UPI002610CA9F|nr:YfjI family protein [uncultured Amphritea sp.]
MRNIYKPALTPPEQLSMACLSQTLLWEASNSLAYQRQVAPEMAVVTFLGCIAISAQGRYDVQLPYGAIRPVSLNICVVSESGEGKTAAESMVMAPLKALQTSENDKYKLNMEEFKKDIDSWQLEHDVLRQKVKSTLSKNGGVAAKEKEALRKHYDVKPIPPRKFRLLYQNTTPEALFQGLSEGVSTAGLATDEGDIFFRTSMSQARGHLNNFYSGDDTIITRATKPDILLNNVRVSTFIMIQPGILYRHQRPEDRDSGWWARFIFCVPGSMRGNRFFSTDTVVRDDSWVAAEKRLKKIADENKALIETPDLPREVLKLSTEAIALWFRLANEIERQMQPGGRFAECPDHASKLADNVARVAALIHIFEEYDGDISESSLRMAIEMCSAFSINFQQVMVQPPQDIVDSHQLSAWFNEQRQFNNRVLPYNYVRQYAPSPLRNKHRLRAAIDILLARNEICLFHNGKTRMINLMPGL